MRFHAEWKRRSHDSVRVARIATIAVAIATMAACATTGHPADFGTAPLYGIVFDESRGPVQWVEVTLNGTETVQTDVDGRFCFPEVARGPISITATAEGYERSIGLHEFTARTQVISIRLRSARSLVTAAVDALRAADFDEATRLASRSLDIDPGNPEALYVAALAAYAGGNRESGAAFLASIARRSAYQAVALLQRDFDRMEGGSQ